MVAGHKNVVLWFSGGKDSMACLYLLKAYLPTITVLWVNTGKYYPELLATVTTAKAMCPHWIEIQSDREAQWGQHGLPSDLVPIDWTLQGQAFSHLKTITVQSYLQCCHDNLWVPMWTKTKELGATLVIRGQRADDTHQSKGANGSSADGILFWHPVEDWTRAQVLAYLTEQMGVLPEHYQLDHSSMDCYDCTAFAAHSHDRVAYMQARHPALYQDYHDKLTQLYQAMAEPMQHYKQLMGQS